MAENTSVYSYKGIPLSNEEEWTPISVTIWMSFKGIVLSEGVNLNMLRSAWFHLYTVEE